MAFFVENGYPVFTGKDGLPLDEGYIFIGFENLNPLSNPQEAFWDEELTIPAADIRTSGGYAVYKGSPARIFTESPHSILVQDKNRSTVYYQPAATTGLVDAGADEGAAVSVSPLGSILSHNGKVFDGFTTLPQTALSATTYLELFNSGVDVVVDNADGTFDLLDTGYDSGWVPLGVWGGATITIMHDLNVPLSELDISFEVSSVADGSDAIRVLDVNADNLTPVDQITGITAHTVDVNSFRIKTGTDGMDIIASDNTRQTLDDENWYYRVVAVRRGMPYPAQIRLLPTSEGGGSGGGGSIATLVAGEPITALDVVYMAADGKVYIADKDTPGSVIGFALANAATDALVTVQGAGEVDGFAGLTAGTEYYLGDDGGLVEFGALEATDNRVFMGTATAVDSMFVNVKPLQLDSSFGGRAVGDMYPSLRPTANPDELAVNGSTFVVANYQTLANSIYVGDSLNATADYGYRCDNADGTSRNTTGAYMKLPDMGGVGIFGLGANGDILMADGSPYDGGTTPVYRLDQFQGFKMDSNVGDGLNYRPLSGSSSVVRDIVQLDSASATKMYLDTFVDDGVNGTPRTGTDTHGAGVGTYWYIKALEVTGSGEPVIAPVPVYDSGWVANSDWTSMSLDADYSSVEGLSGLSKPDLNIDFLLSPTGSDSDSFSPFQTTATSAGGAGIRQSGVDNINIYSASPGFWVTIAPGTNILLDSDSYYYRIIITPKVWTQTAIQQNLGGYTYDLPESGPYDLSSPQSAIDLNTVFAATPGSVTRYSWMNGDGTNALLFNGGTYTGKEIGYVDAVQLGTDMKGEGQGEAVFLTVSSTQIRLLRFSDVDGGGFTGEFEKNGNGIQETSLIGYKNNGVTGTQTFSHVIDYKLLTSHMVTQAGNTGVSASDVQMNLATMGDYTGYESTFDVYVMSLGTGAVTNLSRYFTAKFEGRWTTLHPVVG